MWQVNEETYRVWCKLNAVRSYAAGPSGLIPLGLPYSELSRYAKDRELGTTLTDLDEFVELMWALDRTYLDWWRQQNERTG